MRLRRAAEPSDTAAGPARLSPRPARRIRWRGGLSASRFCSVPLFLVVSVAAGGALPRRAAAGDPADAAAGRAGLRHDENLAPARRDLAESGARRDRRRGREILPASRLRLGRDRGGLGALPTRDAGGWSAPARSRCRPRKTCSCGRDATGCARRSKPGSRHWIELAWSKQRIIEVYLNIVEWGPGIYGAEAAAAALFQQAGRYR